VLQIAGTEQAGSVLFLAEPSFHAGFRHVTHCGTCYETSICNKSVSSSANELQPMALHVLAFESRAGPPVRLSQAFGRRTSRTYCKHGTFPPGSCKTGSYQETKLRPVNKLRIFRHRSIRAGSGTRNRENKWTDVLP
jgi:hypothetical protein